MTVTPQAAHRVVLIGAGAIAVHHALALRAVGQAALAGFIDVDQERAARRAREFGVRVYESPRAAAADGVTVAHILVPPAAHARLTLDCIELGMHVLVEKPMTESIEDCDAIGAAAAARGVCVTANHSLLFDPEIMAAERQIRAGAIGNVIAVDIIRSSEYPSYGGGPLPAYCRDPGDPFRDLGIHALYLLRHFLGEIQGVSPSFRSLGGDPLLAYDEWACTVNCARGIGFVRASWNARPLENLLLIHGTAGMLRVDLLHMFTALRRERRLPKAAARIVNTFADSLKPMWDISKNTLGFMLRRRRQYQGIHGFVADFHARLASGAPLAVTVADASAVVKWTEIVAQTAARQFVPWNVSHPTSPTCDVLVTGGAGRLGSVIVDKLLGRGLRVRVLSRQPPQATARDNLEFIVGDLGDPQITDRAVAGAGAVVHAGAAMSGDRERFRGSTVVGTQNILDAMQRHRVRRLVHVSSLSVVDWAGSSGKAAVDEFTADEPHPELRGYYMQSKLDAERLVRAAASSADIDATILRPGQIFGGRLPVITAAVARRLGPLNLVLGDGRLVLPLVFVEDVADAVSLALGADVPSGTVVQLVDPSRYTQNELLRLCLPGRWTVRIPRPIVFAAGWMSERLLAIVGRRSPISVYRLKSALARLSFAGTAAQDGLGWRPVVGAESGLSRSLRS